ncbi:tape measure domain-containing protein [Bifidobacterium ramosum]|uniref:Tape measure domain-containing protein n=1 Tax=Bifidobacterium ramosum TaxID=1798158 RepID=A0A6L4X3K5_9BIFI|nr:hypothetical protein [Bifidobacterium ramosum]KAB8289306.1 tape measure domain-containing protein [Bifidobacterium ramosum]
MAYQLAQAYVAIVPSMKGVGRAIEAAFEGPAKTTGQRAGEAAGNGFAGRLSSTLGGAVSKIASGAGKVLAGIGKAGLAASAAAIPAIGMIGKSALDAYATWEQAVGGVDTLFKDASKTVQEYAAQAYRTAGVSANDYMNQVTSFAASLVSSLGGNTAEAARMGNQALVDMADNANKMGTDLESLQWAYQGFAKQNYTMLDNLKLGYGGTQEEMKRLISDANKLPAVMKQGNDLSIDSFADVVEAISRVQKKLDISGTTAKEAATTIEGSVGSMKAAWGNWLAELGKDNADMTGLTSELVTSAVTVVKNVVPRVIQIARGLVPGIMDAVGSVAQQLPEPMRQAVESVGGTLNDMKTRVKAAVSWVGDAFTGLRDLIMNGDFTGALRNAFDVEEDSPLVDAILKARDAVIDLWNTVREKLSGLGQSASGWVQPLVDALAGLAKIDLTVFANAVKLTANALKWFLDNGALVTSIVAGLGGAFATLKIGQSVSSGVKTFKDLEAAASIAFDAVKSGDGVFSSISDAIGLLDPKAGGLLSNLGKIAGKIGGLQKAAKLAGGGIKGLSTALGLGPWGLIAAAIAAVVAGLAWFFTQTETGRKAWSSFTSWLSDTWSSIVDTAKGLWQGLSDWFTGLWQSMSDGVTSAWDDVSRFLTDLWASITGGIQDAWNGVVSFFTGILTTISNAFTSVWTAIRGFLMPIVTGIGEFIKNVFIVLAAVLVTIWNGISSVAVTAWDAISGFLKPIVQAIADFIGNVLQGIKNVWENVWTSVGSFASAVWNAIKTAIGAAIIAVSGVISETLGVIRGVWVSVWSAVGSFAVGVWNAIRSVVATAVNAVSGVIRSVLNVISGVWRSVWSGVSSFLSGIWNGITRAVSNGIQNVANTVGRIRGVVLGAVSGAGTWLYDTGRQIISGLIEGVGGAMGWLRDTISGLGSSVLDWAKSVLHIHSPSRVFRDQVGLMIGKGMGLGIADSTAFVRKRMDRLSSTLKPGVAFNYAYGMNGVDRSGYSPVSRSMPGKVVNVTQNMPIKVIRADEDLHTAASILYRNAMREAGTR